MTGLIQMSLFLPETTTLSLLILTTQHPPNFLLRTLIKLFQSTICEQKLTLSINQNHHWEKHRTMKITNKRTLKCFEQGSAIYHINKLKPLSLQIFHNQLLKLKQLF